MTSYQLRSAGTDFAARDIKVNFLVAVPADGRELRATGTVVHSGKRLVIATAQVIHGDERVAVLTGTTALTPPARRRSSHRSNATRRSIRNPAADRSIAATPLTQTKAGVQR